MRLARRLKAAIMRQSLTLQIALLSLIPMVALDPPPRCWPDPEDFLR